MKLLLRGVLIVSVCTLSTFSWADTGRFFAVPSRPGVTVPVWLIAPAKATDIVVLFSGGDGNLRITPKGIKHQGNFLV